MGTGRLLPVVPVGLVVALTTACASGHPQSAPSGRYATYTGFVATRNAVEVCVPDLAHALGGICFAPRLADGSAFPADHCVRVTYDATVSRSAVAGDLGGAGIAVATAVVPAEGCP